MITKNKCRILLSLGVSLLWFNVAIAQEDQWRSARPDGHAPISVMGDHYHEKGEIMISYRYMPMWMKGNLQSTDEVSNEEIHQRFMVAPQSMHMSMHMVGVMYAPTDFLTLMCMVNYISNTMNLSTRMNTEFTTNSGGLGDLTLMGLIKVFNRKRQSLHGNLGVSIPVGDIDQRDETPMMSDAQLAYPMQLGSGTWDPIFSLSYLGQSDRFSWGVQPKYILRIEENSENYTLGNRFDIVGWSAIKVSDYFSCSASLSYFDVQQIDGADADLNPMIMPLFDVANSKRRQLDIGVGTNFYVPSGNFNNLRLAAEMKLPIYQEVSGIQMENVFMMTFGIQYAI